MAIKFNPILGTHLVVLAIFLLHASNAQGGRKEHVGWRKIVGGWNPIRNITDPKVVQIGKFAVDEHNKEAKIKLEFQTVIKGESQVVAGIKYRLIISAKDGDSLHNYLAEVWDRVGGKSRILTSFEDCKVKYENNLTCNFN